MGRYVKNFVANNSATTISLPSGSTDERPEATEPGALRFNSSDNKLEFFNGENFVQVSGAVGGEREIVRDEFILDGSTLTFEGLTTEPLAENSVLVFIEGVYQNETQYTINGTSITLSSTLISDAGKKLHVIQGFATA